MKQLKQKRSTSLSLTHKKSENHNNTSVFEKRPKNVSRYERYRQIQAFREIPLQESSQNNLIRSLEVLNNFLMRDVYMRKLFTVGANNILR
jgi:hypothetical protein